MEDWRLRSRNLKRYPHFDPIISVKEGEAIAKNPAYVASHKFYPFIKYNMHWTSFAPKGELGDAKDREIRYAARRDAYIFSRYRHLLSITYETELQKLDLSDSVLAYRKIPTGEDKGGKCNIHFALDAVNRIRELGNCCVVALDISKFFEHLDHARLKSLWCRMLMKSKLPADHFQVFKAITNYSVIEKFPLYERLGHYGPKRKTKSGKIINGYLTPHKAIPKLLCTGEEFRSKIAGGDGRKSIIKTNYKTYGIPQGAPISDILANLYLIDFDKTIAAHLAKLGGTYFRYSDDILLIVPGDSTVGMGLEKHARDLIGQYGSKLQIKEKKSSVITYEKVGDKQEFSVIKGEKCRNGLEYLGFRYDGNHIFIRDSTIQGLYRKVTAAARREAMGLAKRYPNKSADQLRAYCNFEAFVSRFGRVEDFDELQDNYKKWTFWTYAQRAASIMGTLGTPIRRQLRKQRGIILHKLNTEFDRAVERRKR